jgi:RHS repeat-associated protein
VVYDASGNMTSITDPLGNVTLSEYDAAGNLLKQTDPLGNVTTHTYDANGNSLTDSTPRVVGGVTEVLTVTYQYDRENRVTKITDPNGSTTRTLYDAAGKQSAVIDQLGRSTTNEYDEMGRHVRTIYPDGKSEESVYDADGRRTKSVDAAGRETVYLYDSLGRLVKTTYADGSTTATEYDPLGRPLAVGDASGVTARYEYDAGGRQTKITDALGNATSYTYDANGGQTSMTDARQQTTRQEYDANGRLTKIIYPDGTTTTTVYNAHGNPTAKTDQAGQTTRFEYNGLGLLTKVIDALGGETSYTYDELGNRLTQRDALGRVTSYEYDKLGRRTGRTLPLGMSETYAYDAAGNLTRRTDFRGKTTTFSYDVMSNLLAKTPDPTLGEPQVTFTYTETGQRASMTDASGTTTYTYNAQDALLKKQTPWGALTYTHDARGYVRSLRSSNADGVAINYTYDTSNRLASVTDLRAAGGTTAYAYDANGNLASTTYPNEVATNYTYDALNRLTNVSASRSGANLAGYAYTLGAAGNRLSVTETGGRQVNYTYDALYRLTEERVASGGAVNYTYDAVGNRLTRTSTIPGLASKTSAYDDNDRLSSDAYDLNGNTSTSKGVAYAYDFENRLTEAGGGAVRYVYDGDGIRVAKIAGGVTTHYLVDTHNPTGHAQVVEELRGGQVVRQYTYGHDLISQRQMIGGDWRVSFYGYDGHGSVRYLTDAAGAVTDTYTYDAFGTITGRTGTTPNDYLYAGEQFDPNIGFYYLRARYLNPDSGRFFTQDTYEGVRHDPASLHKYLYAINDPVNRVDPSGNYPIQTLIVGMAIGGLINAMFGMAAGMIIHGKGPSAEQFLHDFGWGAVTAPVSGLFTRLLAPVVGPMIGLLFRALDKMKLMGKINLTGRSATGKLLVRISRYFYNTNAKYPSVSSTALGRFLKSRWPELQWEMHHIWVQQAWSRVGSSQQIYANMAANEGLRRIANGLWNLIPLPKALNAALGRSQNFLTPLFATTYYSMLVYGPYQTFSEFFGDDGEE